MILDARHSDTPTSFSTGISIIGSGAAGMALALALEDSGLDVLLVEAGDETATPAAQDFYRAASIAPASHGPVHLYRRRALGGTTAVWGGRCIPFDPIDFEDRPWINPSGWPITYNEVSAYYARALDICRSGPCSFHARQAISDAVGPMVNGITSGDVILDRIERFSDPAHFGKIYRARLNDSRRITVLKNANVTEICTNATGSAVTGMAARTSQGRSISIIANRIVVAAGGLETPRLLLASRGQRNVGLGNDRDLVGRFYQAHIEGEVGELQFHVPANQVRLDYERSPEGVYCRRYIWLSPEAQRRERTGGLIIRPHHANISDPSHHDPVLSAMYLVKDMLVPEYGRKLTSTERAAKESYVGGHLGFQAAHMRNILFGAPKMAAFSWMWLHRRVLATRKLPSVVLSDPRNCYTIDLNAEQIPNPLSRVALGDEVDALGMPRLTIDWRTVDEDWHMIARGLRTMQRGLAGSGVVDIRFDDEHFEEHIAGCTRIGGHHIGTTRMASGPDRGVVDGNCEAFTTRGLYVVGPSVFPTSGFANPTLTAIALALRLGDHLAGRAAANGNSG